MTERQKFAYHFKGKAILNGMLIDENVEAETMAVSEKKAMSNIKARYKMTKLNRTAGAYGLELVGELTKL